MPAGRLPVVAVVAERLPPEGAYDMTLSWLVRRDLDLVSGVSHRYALGPSDLEGGLPPAGVFANRMASHVVIVACGSSGGDSLVARAIVSDGRSQNAVDAQGSMSRAGALALDLATRVLSCIGVQPTAAELGRLRSASIPDGPAFVHQLRYTAAIWGQEGIDGDAELAAADAAGYARAPMLISAWQDTGENARGFTPDHSQHLAWIERAVAFDPFLVEAHARRVGLLRALARVDEALVAADEALGWAPTSSELWRQRAWALLTLGERDDAVEAASRAHDLAPLDASAVRTLARCLWERGEGKKAEALVEQAARARPDALGLQIAHGINMIHAARYPDAVRTLEAVFRRIDALPWYALEELKCGHLDYHDSARYVLAGWLTEAVAAAGGDARTYARLAIDLCPDPQAYSAAVGGVDGLVGQIKMRYLRRNDDPYAAPDGGITELGRYVTLAFEVQRGLSAGVDLSVILQHFGLDAARWTRASSFWSEKVSTDEALGLRFAELSRRLEASPPPLPRYPAAPPKPAAPAAPVVAAGDGGVKTIEDYARVTAGLQKAIAAGADFMAALASVGLDMARFQSAQTYWSAKMTENPELGMQLAQAMSRYL